MSEKLSALEKAEARVKELKKREKEKKKKEQAKYDKSREKYRLRIGKILDECMKCKNLDSKAFKEYLNKYSDYIEKNCVKK